MSSVVQKIPTASPRSVRERLVSAYASAKSRQDIDAALAVCTTDFLLHAEAFGSRGCGQAAVRNQLQVFYKAFPDYRATLAGCGDNGYGMAAWGECTMTLQGRLIGFAATGKTATLPYISVFTFTGERISAEYFYFDLHSMCEQMGLPLPSVRRRLRLAAKLPAPLLRMLA